MRPARAHWIVFLAFLALPTPGTGADPFYINLMGEGALAHDRGDFGEAARKMRIACFGFLEEPALLASCQVRLALAHAGSGDRPDFEEAFQKIVEIERRFGAYGEAELPTETRVAFEDRVTQWVPAEALADLPGFSPLFRRQTLARLAALPADQRRTELLALHTGEPQESEWIRQLARLDVALRNPAMGQEWAGQLLEEDPADAEALCLRARAAAQTGSCETAVAGLPSCVAGPSTLQEVEEQIGCFLALGNLTGAEARFATAAPELRSQRRMRRIQRRLAEAREEVAARLAALEADGTPTGDPPPAPEGASAGVSAATPAPTREAPSLEALRSRIGGSTELEALRPLATEAGRLADTDPAWLDAQRLAGEAAYRVAEWSEAVRFLERSALTVDEQPALLFYLAVSRYETGDSAGAAEALVRVLPRLRRTALVDRYAQRILEGS